MNNIKRLKATIKETCHQVNIKLCGSILDNIIPNKLNPIFTAEDKRKYITADKFIVIIEDALYTNKPKRRTESPVYENNVCKVYRCKYETMFYIHINDPLKNVAYANIRNKFRFYSKDKRLSFYDLQTFIHYYFFSIVEAYDKLYKQVLSEMNNMIVTELPDEIPFTIDYDDYDDEIDKISRLMLNFYNALMDYDNYKFNGAHQSDISTKMCSYIYPFAINRLNCDLDKAIINPLFDYEYSKEVDIYDKIQVIESFDGNKTRYLYSLSSYKCYIDIGLLNIIDMNIMSEIIEEYEKALNDKNHEFKLSLLSEPAKTHDRNNHVVNEYVNSKILNSLLHIHEWLPASLDNWLNKRL